MPDLSRVRFPLLSNLFFLGVFGITTRLGGNFFHTLHLLSGIVLLLFWSGYWFNRLAVRPHVLPGFSVVSLAICSSLALLILLSVLLRGHLLLAPSVLSLGLVLLNSFLLVIGILVTKDDHPHQSRKPYTWIDYAVVLAPFLLVGVSLLLNSYIVEGDSYYFIFAAQDSFAVGRDISPYTNRPGFIPLLGFLHLGVGTSYFFIFKILLTSLFYFTAPLAYDYIREHGKNAWLSRLLYLLFLGVPVITTEMDIARTQSLVFAFFTPVALLTYRFLHDRANRLFYLALLYACAATQIHELGYPLLLLCGVALCVHIYSTLRARRPSVIRTHTLLTRLGWGAVIIAPYLYALVREQRLIAPFVRNFGKLLTATLSHPHWTWWFLSNYQTTDGWQLGWSGSQAIYYYLYNGILLLLLLIGYRIFLRNWRIEKSFLPLYVYLFVYAATAELLPRLGLSLYPNRVWPHLMLGIWLLTLLASTHVRLVKPRAAYLVTTATLLVIASGLAGWFIVTQRKGGFVTPEESKISSFMHDTLEPNAIVYTTQDSSSAIIRLFAARELRSLPYTSAFSRPQDVVAAIQQAERDRITQRFVLENTIVRTQRLERLDGSQISETKEVLAPDPPALPPITLDDPPVYLFYSFARFKGLVGEREWWRIVNNYNNLAFFSHYQGAGVVYRDDAGIVIRVSP